MEKEKKLSSIKAKLILMMVLITAVPIIVITILSTNSSRNTSIKQTVELNNAQAHIIQQDILSILDQNMRALQSIAAAPSTVAYLSGETEYGDSIIKQLQEIDAIFNDGNAIAISGSDGMQVLKSAGDCVDVSEREYFKAAMEGSEYVSDIQVSKSNGSRISTFAVPIKDASGKVIGIIQRNYNLSVFHDKLAKEVTEDQQEVVMVDNTGSVIAHSGHDIDPENPEDQSGNPFYTDSRGDKTNGSYVSTFEGKTWMVSWYKEAKTGWVVASCRLQSVALSSINKTSLISALLGAGFLVICIILSLSISKSFTAPIKEIGESMEALSDGRFVKINAFTDRQDEFGAIIREVNSVIDKLKKIVSGIKESASSVNKSSEQLADMSSRITQTSDDVSNAVQEIAGGATQQAEEIQEAVENTTLISNNIQKVTEDAINVSATADQMNTNSLDSKEQLERLKDSSKEMNGAIEAITEKISATEAAVERISEKVAAINSIASQTNLLALNASIEAARAGEMGKGFAVVAEEIGKLADESGASANEIRQEMDLLLKESQSAVEMARKVTEITETEQGQILNDTVASITKLIQGIQVSVNGIDSITLNAKNCEESKAGITDSMNSLSAISEENAAASEETAASMQQLGEIVSALATDAQSLKDISNQLSEDMKFFKD
ncbi:MAG: methyl-accepting chemotaxis protein [Lachnospiraceae bacterium]|nr:methyl-accepting chemotaxis protein [Lachnospiraceae bacterium]